MAAIIPERIGHGPLYFFVTTFTAFLCLFTVVYTSHWFLPLTSPVFIVASMGAAAVVMYAAPGSPMAKEWAFVTGNLSAAVVGVSCFRLMGDSAFTGPVAVASAIGVMHLLRCQHPPGGATALFAVIGGSEIHAMGYHYVLAPVALNVGVFLVFVLLHRKFLSWHAARSIEQDALRNLLEKAVRRPLISTAELPVAESTRIDDEDIDYALAVTGTYLDIGREQIKNLLESVLKRRSLRNSFELHCAEIMRNDKPLVAYGDSLLDAWLLMKKHDCDFLVVVDRGGFVEGVLRLQHLVESIREIKGIPISAPAASLRFDRRGKEFDRWLKVALAPTGNVMTDKPEVVGQLMEQGLQASSTDIVADLLRTHPNDNKEITMPIAVVADEGRYKGYIDLRHLLG